VAAVKVVTLAAMAVGVVVVVEEEVTATSGLATGTARIVTR